MTDPIDRRRALAALGVLGASAALAACSSGDDAGTDGGPSTTASTTSSTSTTPTGGAAGLAARFEGSASCSLSTALMEGPYYIDVDGLRSDIRDDREGSPLRVGLRVLDAGCEPIRDALVEIWHCDATGLYSGFEAASEGRGSERDDTRYLRGGQLTDGDGIAVFTTVYPGWYPGRTVHIHVKVHVSNREVLTTQVFFDESVTDAVHRSEPYAADGERDTTNATDGIFDERLILTLSEEGDGHLGLLSLVTSPA